MKHEFTRLISLILIISLVAINTSCDKEKLEERPELPPAESLIMDFSDFDTRPSSSKGIYDTYNNFVYSYLNVLFWHGFTSLTLALPVTAYAAALNETPEYLGDNTWEWSFDVTVATIAYTATLTGKRISNEEFTMEMIIALSSAPENGFTWFDGTVRYDHTKANWNLYKDADGTSVKIIETEWNKNYETEESDLTYTYVEPGQNESGSFITYGKTNEGDYDLYYTISLAAGLINIEWDSNTKAGRFNSTIDPQTGEWKYWNSDLMDID